MVLWFVKILVVHFSFMMKMKKIIKLDKKYPKLREKIRLDAINNSKEEIEWLKERIKN
jgi:hypothetical protein